MNHTLESLPPTTSFTLSGNSLLALADTDFDGFAQVFSALRQTRRAELVRACLTYLGSGKSNEASRQMLAWLSYRDDYTSLLLDPTFMTVEQAVTATAQLREADPRFLSKFMSHIYEVGKRDLLLVRRALAILPALGDYGSLMSWLLSLTRESDDRVRSKATKLICGLRPNPALIERQMTSEDARVRANAIEALWHRQEADIEAIFHSAISDSHHRVVMNAAIGLFYQNNPLAFEILQSFAEHSQPLFRSAAAWALGQTRDTRAYYPLKALLQDSAATVRAQASRAIQNVPVPEETPVCEAASTPGTRAEPARSESPDTSAHPITKQTEVSGYSPRFWQN